jgi:hypothetical protein
MKKNTVVDLVGRTTMPDRLTELPRTGTEYFIYQTVEAELQEVLTEHSRRRTENARRGLFATSTRLNGLCRLGSRIGDCPNPEDTGQDRSTGHLSFGSGPAGYGQDTLTGSSIPL